jgi:hypothetical protein
MFVHNTADVPVIIAACTKAVLTDENTDLVSADASGVGVMVKGNQGEWEGYNGGTM